MTTPADHRAAFVFSAAYGAQFAFLGIQLPFFSGWLALNGFSIAEIGWLNGAALLLRLILGPVCGALVDRLSDQRRGLQFASLALALGAAGLVVGDGKAFLALSSLVMLTAFGIVMPLMDTAALHAQSNQGLQFGPVRAIGSSSFMAANIAAGLLLTNTGLGAVAPAMATATLLAFLFSFAMPSSSNNETARLTWAAVTQVLRKKKLPFMLAAVALNQGSHGVYYTFSILHWKALGFSPFVIGALWATGVLAEIGLLALGAARWRRFSPALWVMLGGLGAGLRWIITPLEPPLTLLFIVQCMHALTFAATFIGTIGFVDAAVDQKNRNLVMTLFSTIGIGAATGVASIAGGYIYDVSGAFNAYALMAAMGVAGAIIAGFVWRTSQVTR